MKKLIALFIFLLIVVTPAFAGDNVIEYEALTFSNADTVLTTIADTSNTFNLYREQLVQGVRKMETKQVYPSNVSFLFWITKYASSDSSVVTFYLDLTNDGTYWYQYGAIESHSDLATAAETNVGEASYDFDISRIISSVAVALDTAAVVNTWEGTNTYTYTTSTPMPCFKKGRIRYVPAQVGDTCAVGVQLNRIFK